MNRTSHQRDLDLERITLALQTQVTRDFAPIWGVDAHLQFVPRDSAPPADAWHLIFLDNSDLAGALGYHDLTHEGRPQGKVFYETALAWGDAPSVTASHELLEMLADPGLNIVAYSEGQVLLAVEVCDPCGADEHSYLVEGTAVSDFVYPAYYQPFWAESAVLFDHRGYIRRPFELLPGGFVSVNDLTKPDGWQIRLYDGEPLGTQAKGRAPVGSRRERRRTDCGCWLKSTAR